MAVETTTWDIAEYLETNEDIAAYLGVVLEGGDPDEMRRALGHVSRAKGMTQLAKMAGLSRAGLYKALGEGGNPSISTVTAILKALGLKLSVKPLAAE